MNYLKMDYTAFIITIIFSLHSSCLGSLPGLYQTPNGGDVCPCDGLKKNIIPEMSTIRVTKTEQPPPIMETKSLPPVTSYMTLPVVNETITVIVTKEQSITITTTFTPPPVITHTDQPMATVLMPYSVTSTAIKEPVTKIRTQEVTKFVPAKPFLTTLLITSTEPQEPTMHVITFTPITNTEIAPLAISFITSQIIVTEALPPVIRTVRFGSTTTLGPHTVTVTPQPVTIHSPPSITFETIGITDTSTAQPITTFRTQTIYKTNTNCGSQKDYNYDAPSNALEFNTPTATFKMGQ